MEIRGIKEGAISGALNEVYKLVEKYHFVDNLIVSTVRNIYNFFFSKAPFAWLLSPTIIGE